MNTKQIALFVVAIIVIGGAAFYGGMRYASAKQPAVQQRFAGTFRNVDGGAAPGRNGASAPVIGEVLSKDASSITVKLRDGGSRVVLYSASTVVGKMAPGTIDDILPGTNVMVTGSQNSDGSVTAAALQIRPAGSDRSSSSPMIIPR
ncbi:hypothetical protein KBD18_00960 [Patescibacteria group bacterium]|nr:hypothetical protein [Patescibacteria group bacterium]